MRVASRLLTRKQRRRQLAPRAPQVEEFERQECANYWNAKYNKMCFKKHAQAHRCQQSAEKLPEARHPQQEVPTTTGCVLTETP